MGSDLSQAARFGAVSFVQRFGSALNTHTHLHCCVTDGVFSLAPAGTLQFHTAADLDAAALSAVQRRIRSRVLPLAVRHGALTPEVAPTPLELLDRLAALMPWPRRHRHHYAGVFAPHAKLRARDPPVLDAGFTCAFDSSPWWDSTAAASEPSFHFDQTLN